MTCAERIRRIRIMEKMNNNSNVKKEADGTMKYVDKDGNVLIEAKVRAK